jgi:hypothetical protein
MVNLLTFCLFPHCSRNAIILLIVVAFLHCTLEQSKNYGGLGHRFLSCLQKRTVIFHLNVFCHTSWSPVRSVDCCCCLALSYVLSRLEVLNLKEVWDNRNSVKIMGALVIDFWTYFICRTSCCFPSPVAFVTVISNWTGVFGTSGGVLGRGDKCLTGQAWWPNKTAGAPIRRTSVCCYALFCCCLPLFCCYVYAFCCCLPLFLSSAIVVDTLSVVVASLL